MLLPQTWLRQSVLKLDLIVVLAVLTALVARVTYACQVCDDDDNGSSSSRAYVQLGGELVQSGEG
jgi:hypothetical protein